MKKEYVRPEVDYINFYSVETITDLGTGFDTSGNVEDLGWD